MTCPPQFTDLPPIELVWNELDLENSNRIYNEWEWAFSVLEEYLERSAIYIFSKPLGKNVKNLWSSDLGRRWFYGQKQKMMLLYENFW